MAIAGLDIGTSGCKFTIMDDSGEVCGTDYCAYEAKREGGYHELDGNDIWNAVKQVIKNAAAQCPDQKIEAFGVDSLGEMVIPMDRDDNIIGRGIIYTDCRGEEEMKELTEKMGGKARIMEITGVAPATFFSVCKLMWLKRHTDIYDRADKLPLIEDFIIYQLTGRRMISYSLAARTMALDIRTLTWSREICDATGIDPAKFSTPVPSGTIVGPVKEELANELGLPLDTRVCTGGHDQACCAVGSGVLRPGICCDVTGTIHVSTMFVEKFQPDEFLLKNTIPTVPHAVKGAYYSYTETATGGVLLQWFRDTIARYEYELAKKEGKDIYYELDKQVKDAPSGLLITPHFAGTGTPDHNPHARAAMLNVSLETKPIDIYKGLMEGLAYEMRTFYDLLEEEGIRIDEFRAGGGGAKSPVWLQIKADVTGKSFTALKNAEAGTIGCIMLTGVALGKYKDLQEAADHLIRLGKTYVPNPEKSKIYDQYYEKYKKMYSSYLKIMK